MGKYTNWHFPNFLLELSKMKKSANVIIVSRGGIIDESALYDSLSKGNLAGAAFDAFETESM